MNQWLRAHRLDRCEGLRRDVSWVEQLWRSSAAVVVHATEDGRLSIGTDGQVWTSTSGDYDPQHHHLLGLLDQSAVFATTGVDGTSLRALLDGLTDAQVEVAFTAVGLIGWHARAGFCPRCGAATRAISGGAARLCPDCLLEDYPRTDPAVIVAITDAEDRLLLARQPSWPAGRVSVLAGFAEVGESLEQTVHREIGEEVGLTVSQVRYVGSQPWPFPRSMMVAFRAVADPGALRPAPGEIEAADWYSREALRAALDRGDLTVPSPVSIARRLIEAWLEAPTAEAPVEMWPSAP